MKKISASSASTLARGHDFQIGREAERRYSPGRAVRVSACKGEEVRNSPLTNKVQLNERGQIVVHVPAIVLRK